MHNFWHVFFVHIECCKDIICIAWSSQWINVTFFFCPVPLHVRCILWYRHFTIQYSLRYAVCKAKSGGCYIHNINILPLLLQFFFDRLKFETFRHHNMFEYNVDWLMSNGFPSLSFFLDFIIFFLIHRHQISPNWLRAEEKLWWNHRGVKQRGLFF